MRLLALLVAAFAAVTFPVYLVVNTLRMLLMLLLAPILGILLAVNWTVRQWGKRKEHKTHLIGR